MCETVYEVYGNGQRFAVFGTEDEATAYCDMQRCKKRGAGVGRTPAPEPQKALAARMTWVVIARGAD